MRAIEDRDRDRATIQRIQDPEIGDPRQRRGTSRIGWARSRAGRASRTARREAAQARDDLRALLIGLAVPPAVVSVGYGARLPDPPRAGARGPEPRSGVCRGRSSSRGAVLAEQRERPRPAAGLIRRHAHCPRRAAPSRARSNANKFDRGSQNLRSPGPATVQPLPPGVDTGAASRPRQRVAARRGGRARRLPRAAPARRQSAGAPRAALAVRSARSRRTEAARSSRSACGRGRRRSAPRSPADVDPLTPRAPRRRGRRSFPINSRPRSRWPPAPRGCCSPTKSASARRSRPGGSSRISSRASRGAGPRRRAGRPPPAMGAPSWRPGSTSAPIAVDARWLRAHGRRHPGRRQPMGGAGRLPRLGRFPEARPTSPRRSTRTSGICWSSTRRIPPRPRPSGYAALAAVAAARAPGGHDHGDALLGRHRRLRVDGGARRGATARPPPLMFRRSREDVGDPRRRRHRFAGGPHHAAPKARLQRLLERYSREVWRDAPADVEGARLAVTILRKRALSSPAAAARSLRRRLELLLAQGRAPAPRQLSLFDEDDDAGRRGAGRERSARPGLADAALEQRWLTALIEAADAAAGVDSKQRCLRRLLRRIGRRTGHRLHRVSRHAAAARRRASAVAAAARRTDRDRARRGPGAVQRDRRAPARHRRGGRGAEPAAALPDRRELRAALEPGAAGTAHRPGRSHRPGARRARHHARRARHGGGSGRSRTSRDGWRASSRRWASGIASARFSPTRGPPAWSSRASLEEAGRGRTARSARRRDARNRRSATRRVACRDSAVERRAVRDRRSAPRRID